jgi:cytochrome c oxidase subunit 4
MSTDANHGHVKEYIIVFIVLTVLTVVELFIPGLKNVTTMTKGISLTLLAIAKAAVVGYFYMHLKDETKWLKFIAIIPISAALYAAMVILESIYR